jgi:hypothetical protein
MDVGEVAMAILGGALTGAVVAGAALRGLKDAEKNIGHLGTLIAAIDQRVSKVETQAEGERVRSSHHKESIFALKVSFEESSNRVESRIENLETRLRSDLTSLEQRLTSSFRSRPPDP